MPQKDVEFQTIDGVTLRGWLFTPNATTRGAPCLVMAHGWTALKEMDLDAFAAYFVQALPITCLVYDNRGFGTSDTLAGAPRHEIVPSQQQSDYSDAITYAQSLPEVDPEKIAIWGSSYSGGHVLYVGAVDRRVKAVLCQVPLTDGWSNFHRLIRPDFVASMNQAFQAGMFLPL
ncbi:Alpha/Beta hydrolase protein [Neohortaea acidophila]|uniref:Alpha/Beta hydrolase protein n=1 Tax=Neohortaea acidophila TaxID=245834 RepID=A0A6A6PIP7_9PEZI|nr:Alpha/Beta hydrolase protein [Neohortaea acidophila]KAF2479889.1 Alpha/Beta hydrolase protein [Neohortaea acidophila]